MQIATEARPSFRSSTHRPGSLGLIKEAFSEAFRRRRLVRYLVQADIKRKGGDSLLGNLWWVLDPLLEMGVYIILLVVIFQRKTPDFPLFIFCALLPWKWFASSIGESTASVVRQEKLIKQLQFPKIVFPIAAITAQIVNLFFGTIILMVMLFVAYPQHATINMLWLPFIALVQWVFTLGLSLIVASVNVFYRDVGILSGHLIRMWWFLSPGIWSFSGGGRFETIESALGPFVVILKYNPFAVLLTAYRDVIYGRVDDTGNSFTPGQPPDLIALGVLLVLSMGLVVLGALVFKRLEPAFAKVL